MTQPRQEAVQFNDTLNAWGLDSFQATLKAEIKNLESGILPLEKATTQGGMIDDSNISVSVLNKEEREDIIQIKTGVFFNEIIGGCNCDDEPHSENVYCEILISIDKLTARTVFEFLHDNN